MWSFRQDGLQRPKPRTLSSLLGVEGLWVQGLKGFWGLGLVGFGVLGTGLRTISQKPRTRNA